MVNCDDNGCPIPFQNNELRLMIMIIIKDWWEMMVDHRRLTTGFLLVGDAWQYRNQQQAMVAGDKALSKIMLAEFRCHFKPCHSTLVCTNSPFNYSKLPPSETLCWCHNGWTEDPWSRDMRGAAWGFGEGINSRSRNPCWSWPCHADGHRQGAE